VRDVMFSKKLLVLSRVRVFLCVFRHASSIAPGPEYASRIEQSEICTAAVIVLPYGNMGNNGSSGFMPIRSPVRISWNVFDGSESSRCLQLLGIGDRDRVSSLPTSYYQNMRGPTTDDRRMWGRLPDLCGNVSLAMSFLWWREQQTRSQGTCICQSTTG
jgi:hypothetical protein